MKNFKYRVTATLFPGCDIEENTDNLKQAKKKYVNCLERKYTNVLFLEFNEETKTYQERGYLN